MEALLLLSNTSECDADCGWSTQWQRAFKEGFYTESACHSGDPGLIPGSARFPGKGIGYPLQCSWASPVAQLVKNLPAMWDTWVRSLGWEDLLEEGMAIYSRILAWRILMDRGAWWAIVHGVSKSATLVKRLSKHPTSSTIQVILRHIKINVLRNVRFCFR